MNATARSALLALVASALAATVVHSSLAAPASASTGATAAPAPVRFLRARSIDFEGRFDEHGASFRVDGRPVGVSTERIGRASAMRELRAAPPFGAPHEVRFARAEGIVEWWRAATLGLEHGYDIATRPEGEGELVVELRVTGLAPVRARGGIELRDGEQARLRYDGLHVYDARGRALASSLSTREGRLRIEVDDRGAVYPIVIDPLLTPTWSLRSAISPQSSESFGEGVGVSSDVIVVGAPSYDRSAAAEYNNEGRAFAYNPGSTKAYALPRTATRVDNSSFGAAVAVDGSRFVIGAPGESFHATDVTNEGAAYFYARTSTTTWSELPLRLSAQEAMPEDRFGSAVAIRGDVVAVGAPGRESDAGIVYLFSDASGTMTMIDSVTAPEPTADQAFGATVALDGDTLVVGAPGTSTVTGAVYLYTREADGTFTFLKTLDRDPWSVSISGDSLAIGLTNAVQIFDRTDGVWPDEESQTLTASYSLPGVFGVTTAISGDLLLVGDYGQPGNTWDLMGQAELFYRNPATGVWASANSTLNPGAEAGDLFGWRVALDGGVGVVGAPSEDGSGRAFVFTFRLAQGTPCRAESAEVCEHGFCVDGVCCEAACDGACHACSEARGSSADGTCGVRPESSVCRPVADACDLPEVCDGATYACPADARMDACVPPDAGSGGTGGGMGGGGGTIGETPSVPREELSCTCEAAGRGGAAGALPSTFLVLMALGVGLARSRARRSASGRRGGLRG